MSAGGCPCGAVRYELRGATTRVTYCPCSMCRKWHGDVGAYAAVDRADLVVVEERALEWHAPSANVRWGFCVEYGSCLFFDTAGDPKVAFSAGTLDEPTNLTSKAHIFVASKGDYYAMTDDGLLRHRSREPPSDHRGSDLRRQRGRSSEVPAAPRAAAGGRSLDGTDR